MFSVSSAPTSTGNATFSAVIIQLLCKQTSSSQQDRVLPLTAGTAVVHPHTSGLYWKVGLGRILPTNANQGGPACTPQAWTAKWAIRRSAVGVSAGSLEYAYVRMLQLFHCHHVLPGMIYQVHVRGDTAGLKG